MGRAAPPHAERWRSQPISSMSSAVSLNLHRMLQQMPSSAGMHACTFSHRHQAGAICDPAPLSLDSLFGMVCTCGPNKAPLARGRSLVSVWRGWMS